MSINRIQVTSDSIVQAAMNTGSFMMGETPVPDCPYDTDTRDSLDVLYPEFLEGQKQRRLTKSNFTSANKSLETAEDALRHYCISYLELVNLKIRGGYYPKSIRLLFKMKLHKEALPYMDTSVALQLVAAMIIFQDPQFALRGLRLMTDYNATELADLLADCETKNGVKLNCHQLMRTARDEFKVIRKKCVTLVIAMWDQTEFFFRKKKKPALRKACRQWGIVYEQSKVMTNISVLGRYKDGGKIVAAAKYRIGYLLTERNKVSREGTKKTANQHGVADLWTSQTGALYLIGEVAGCLRSVSPLTIVAGENQVITVRFERLAKE